MANSLSEVVDTKVPGRILVDHAGNKGIGDIVCELNYYRALRGRFPAAELVSRGSRTLAWGNPLIAAFDERSPDDAFDLVIRQPSLAAITEDLGRALREEETIFDLFLRHQGFDPLPGAPELFVLPREQACLDLGLEASRQLVVVFSVDSKEPDRRWGQERFQALARHFQDAHGALVIELGAGVTEGHMGVGLDLVGQTDLRQAMAILSGADLFVGNNGGLTHLAGGVGTPILVPWGANSPYDAYAYDDTSVALGTAPPCRNCGWTGVFLPECLEVDTSVGRTPCTQDIAVADMAEAADELIPLLHRDRAPLQEARLARARRARDPLGLAVFDQEREVAPYAHLVFAMGGAVNWVQAHRPDNFSRLRKIVAFPDWLAEGDTWKQLIAGYIERHEASSDWALVLSAFPLSASQVREALEHFIFEQLKPAKEIPKILVYLGNLTPAEREILANQSAARI